MNVIGFWDVISWILVDVHRRHVSDHSNFNQILKQDIFCNFYAFNFLFRAHNFLFTKVILDFFSFYVLLAMDIF
jgi:hypothetical protein